MALGWGLVWIVVCYSGLFAFASLRRTGKKILTQHTGLPPRDDGKGKPSRANKRPRNRGSRD